MTRGFWRDPDKYLETYWSRIPGVWVHGDWASVDADGFWFLHGRSDDTMNIAGKRIGPAELESAAVGHPAVREAAAIGVPHEVKGETAWIFCCLLPGARGDRGGGRRARRSRARQGLQARPGLLRRRAAEDALGEDRAPRRQGDGARHRPRRPLVAREPRVTRPDRSSSWLNGLHSSPAEAAGSAPRSRARSPATAGRRRRRAVARPGRRGRGGDRRPRDRAGRLRSRVGRARLRRHAGDVDLLVANAGVGNQDARPGATLLVAHVRGERARRAPLLPRPRSGHARTGAAASSSPASGAVVPARRGHDTSYTRVEGGRRPLRARR